MIRYFNPRSREGSDHGHISRLTGRINFNPRSREGSDYAGLSGCYGLCNFNPRSREGSDDGSRPMDIGEYEFQSTLP